MGRKETNQTNQTDSFKKHGGFLNNVMYHYRETIKSNTHIMMIHDSHIVRAKETIKLSYGGPSLPQASGIKQRTKALCQGRH